MKKINKGTYYLAVIMAAVCFMYCGANESTEAGIQNIKFAESAKYMCIGDITTIAMLVMPLEAKNTGKVIYSVSEPGIVEISKGSGNDGVIIGAINEGTVVVAGKANGFVDYCNITVSGGETHSIPNNKPLNIGSIKVQWQNGEQQATEDLWTTSGVYVVGYNKWYFYNDEQYNNIINGGYNSNYFTAKSDIANVNLVPLYAGYTYGSKEAMFTGKNMDEGGTEVDIPITETGYFYPQATVNTYKSLFSDYTPLTTYPYITTGKVFSEQIKKTCYSPIYEERELFVYSRYTAGSINNFEDINDMNEDQWGNKAALLARLPSLLEFLEGDEEIDIKDLSFSFHTPPYSQWARPVMRSTTANYRQGRLSDKEARNTTRL